MNGNSEDNQETHIVEKNLRGSKVKVEVSCFPGKHTTVNVAFNPTALDNYCDVAITLIDENNKRFRSYKTVRFHSDGRVLGYGYLANGVRFRTIKPDRDRKKGAYISVT